jgi:ABC-type glycerol-3-phosphate transport system substrate-binding protein
MGGELFDGRNILLGTHPKNLEAMRWMEAFTRDNGGDAVKIFASGFGSWASSQSAFFSGKLAMVFQGVWYDNYIRQYKPGLDYGVGLWPWLMAASAVTTVPIIVLFFVAQKTFIQGIATTGSKG